LGSLQRLEKLDLTGTPLTAEDLELVARLKRLEALVIRPPQDRAAWQHLGQLTRLQRLRIPAGGTLKPGDLRFLANMPQLRTFWLQSSIEGDVLADLAHVPQLTELRLQANHLRDSDLRYVAGHTQLRHLTLEGNSGNYVTDKGLAVIANFRELSFLNISNCRSVTDCGLAHVSGLRYLRTVRLSGTGVTNEGLAHLSGLTRLVNLHVDRTAVTPEGLKQLGPRPDLRTLRIEIDNVPPYAASDLKQQFANAVIN
jgi:Leucine-rich repeat (LRR) protein